MKKLFTYAFSALFMLGAVNVFAQDEEDVTNYIANPGFDEDITFGIDGSWKATVDKKSLSDRSEAWIAEDSTIYAHTKSSSSQSRPDGRKADAVNGFIGRVNGWTIESNQDFPKCEWVYFGTVPYDLANQAIPIADDGTTYLEVPTRPEADAGEDNKAFVYLRAGWGGRAVYKQVVKLPCAQYRLEYWAINLNKNASNGKNLSKVICRKDVFADETGFNDQEWTLHTIEFTPTSEFTIQFGFESSGGSGSNPFLCIDGIKLYKIGEADEVELLSSDLNDLVDSLMAICDESPIVEYSGLVAEGQNYGGDILAEVDDDVDALNVAIAQMKAKIAEFQAAKDLINQFDSLVLIVDDYLNLDPDQQFAGIDVLNNDVESIRDIVNEDNEELSIDEFKKQLAALQKAINDYRYSQPASKEEPADYTFLIENPKFVQVNPDDSKDLSKSAWYIGQEGGDQRFHTGLTDNEGSPITAWNAWRNNLTSTAQSVSINQDLVDLPNGFYTVTADLCTQDGCISDQHVYANGTIQSVESPVMTETGWNPYVWETLTTAMVVVTDGKLTIGVIGHGDADTPDQHGGSDTDARRGWFCATNFKLNYLGEATADEIAAIKAAKFEAAEAQAAAMHLAADKVAFQTAIAAAKETEDFAALNEAIAEAEASETDYVNVINGSYKALQDSIAKFEGSDPAKVSQVVVDLTTAYLVCDTASYKGTGVYTNILQYYLNNVDPAIYNASQEKYNKPESKQIVTDAISGVVAELMAITALPTTEYLDAEIAKITAALNLAAAADVEYGAGKDVTAYIVNAAITDANATGWTVNKVVGDGNGAKNGQAKNDDGDDYYIDTYNSVPGAVRATYYQTLNVPNGIYELSADQRNAGGGYYLFASTAAPTENETKELILDTEATNVLSLAKLKTTNVAKYISALYPDSIGAYADTYGEYWMQAADLYLGLTGIEGATETETAYDMISDVTAGDAIEGYEAEWKILSANGGKGRGWFSNKLQIEVTDHVLTVGVSNDSVFTAGLLDTDNNATVPFTGTWFSANDFKLVMLSEGDNADWSIVTEIETVATAPEKSEVVAIYAFGGQQVATLQKGLNIVKYADGTVKKVFVR
jgi:hypothetical protein